MTGFEPQISGVGINRPTNSTTITAREIGMFLNALGSTFVWHYTTLPTRLVCSITVLMLFDS